MATQTADPNPSISVKADFLAEVDEAAAAMHGTRSEFIRAALRYYIRHLRATGQLPARKAG